MNHARRDLCGGHPAMGVPTAKGLAKDIRLKENAPKFGYSTFYGTTSTSVGRPAALLRRI